MGVILPSEYQQVEFLEKPLLASVAATVYIDTGIITSSNIDYDFVGQALGDNETVTFFGAREAFQNKSNEVIYTLHHDSVPTGAQFRYGNKAGATAVFAESPAINIHEVKRYKKEGTVFTCNNSSSTTAQQTFSCNKTITLFDVNQRIGIVGNTGGARIYYFKLYESGVLVRDYIPCYRKSDNKPGMYDLVSGTFFTNAGTGEFTVGPDVIDSISPWMVARRRGLMKEPELYPVGTNIRAKYGAVFVSEHTIDTITGEYVENSSYQASPVYMPISPKYTYWKRGTFPNRAFLSVLAFYDKDKNYISYYGKNDYGDFVIPDIPSNARYARIAIPSGSYNDVKIIRTA